MKHPFLLLLTLFHMEGVAVSDTGEVKTVSVNEGDTVTLQTDAELQIDDHILWLFLRKDILLLQFNRLTNRTSLYDGADGRFKDRLNVNHQTGDLTITNIKAEHTGVYQVEIINPRKPSYKRFSVIVHAHLPVPVINSPQCISSEQLSSSNCSFLCLVLNVTDVSLSWYKGNSLLSSISVSDLNIRLSLSLEVGYQDTNTYSCVVTNSTSNQTQHLNITHDCWLCSGVSEKQDSSSNLNILFSVLVFSVLLLIVVAVVIFCICRKFRKSDGKTSRKEDIKQNGFVAVKQDDEAHNGLNSEGEADQLHDDFKTVLVKMRATVILHTDTIEDEDEILWKFAESKFNTVKSELIAKRTSMNNGEILCSNERFRDRLQLNNQTGSLTITNITTEDNGYYKLLIPKKKISKIFYVLIVDQ